MQLASKAQKFCWEICLVSLKQCQHQLRRKSVPRLKKAANHKKGRITRKKTFRPNADQGKLKQPNWSQTTKNGNTGNSQKSSKHWTERSMIFETHATYIITKCKKSQHLSSHIQRPWNLRLRDIGICLRALYYTAWSHLPWWGAWSHISRKDLLTAAFFLKIILKYQFTRKCFTKLLFWEEWFKVLTWIRVVPR